MFSALANIYTLQREEFEVVPFVEPGALEHFEWQPSSSAQGERIDGELDMGVPFPSGFGLVVEDEIGRASCRERV